MKKKILILTVAILVLAFSLLCFSACTSFDKFMDKASDVLDEVIAMDDAGTALYEGKTYDMPRALKFYTSSPNSNKTIRLTASITPASAADKTVDWSVAWSNPSSTWATGKTVTDYVTVTPTSDGALTADVHFVANFGEQILVTVTSREVSSVSTSCTVDCYQTFGSAVYELYSSLNGGLSTLSSSSDLRFPSIGFFKTGSYNAHNQSYCAFRVQSSMTSDPYTLDLTSRAYSVRLFLKRSSSFESALASSFQGTRFANSFGSAMSWTEVTMDAVNIANYEDQTFTTMYDFYHVLFSGVLTTANDTDLEGQGFYYYNRAVGALQNTTGYHFSVKVEVTFGDNPGTITSEYNVSFSASSIGVVAQNVSLSQTGIQF